MKSNRRTKPVCRAGALGVVRSAARVLDRVDDLPQLTLGVDRGVTSSAPPKNLRRPGLDTHGLRGSLTVHPFASPLRMPRSGIGRAPIERHEPGRK
jgi:hypothetical protein